MRSTLDVLVNLDACEFRGRLVPLHPGERPRQNLRVLVFAQADSLGIQPRVKSLRSSYTDLYEQNALHSG